MQTFLDALDTYERERSQHKKGYKQEKARIAELRASSLARVQLDTFKRADVRAYRNEKAATGVSGSTTNRFLALISSVLKWALAEHDAGPGKDIVKGLKLPENPPRTERPTEAEFDAICKHLPGWALAWAHVARETAMRRGEIARARWEHLDLERRVLRIFDLKNGDLYRDVPLSTRACNVLRAMQKISQGDLIFDRNPDSFTQAWIRARKAANVRGIRGHDLRADRISSLLEKGWTLPDVRKVSGHRSAAILRYVRGGDAADLARRMDLTT